MPPTPFAAYKFPRSRRSRYAVTRAWTPVSSLSNQRSNPFRPSSSMYWRSSITVEWYHKRYHYFWSFDRPCLPSNHTPSNLETFLYTLVSTLMALYAATLAAIVIVLLAVSLTRLGKVRTRADYLVAGRSLPAFVLVFTLLCSWIGSGSLLAAAENGYRHGFAALWVAAGGWAGLALIYFIAPRPRRFAQFTIPDLLEARYNQAARILGVIAILFTAIAGMSSVAYMDVAIGLLATVTLCVAPPVLNHNCTYNGFTG